VEWQLFSESCTLRSRVGTSKLILERKIGPPEVGAKPWEQKKGMVGGGKKDNGTKLHGRGGNAADASGVGRTRKEKMSLSRRTEGAVPSNKGNGDSGGAEGRTEPNRKSEKKRK